MSGTETNPTNLPAFQRRVENFVEARGLQAPVQTRVLDLASEVGELAKEALEGTDYGRARFQRRDGWQEELGDAMFSLSCLANSTGVDLEMALDGVLEKYRRRLDLRNDASSGR